MLSIKFFSGGNQIADIGFKIWSEHYGRIPVVGDYFTWEKKTHKVGAVTYDMDKKAVVINLF